MRLCNGKMVGWRNTDRMSSTEHLSFPLADPALLPLSLHLRIQQRASLPHPVASETAIEPFESDGIDEEALVPKRWGDIVARYDSACVAGPWGDTAYILGPPRSCNVHC